MKDLFRSLFERLAAASATQKAIASTVLVAAVAVVGIGSWLSSQPHWEVLVSDLDDRDFARVGEALAGSGVKWRSSQPPRPFVVYVDAADRATALNAVMSAGALAGSERGILTGSSGGMGSVFLYSKEREQLTRKKEWQDMETMLEFQDFIREARVRTSRHNTDLLDRGGESSASVTLILERGSSLSRSQGRTVADLVRQGLGIAPQNLVVSDQSGRMLYNGADEVNGTRSVDEWNERAQADDRRLTEQANDLLNEILGPGLARVTVLSEWDLDQTVQLVDSSDPKQRAVTQETKRTTQTPVFPSPAFGTGAGTSSNDATASEFGVDNQGVVDHTTQRPANTEPALGRTSEETASYVPTRTFSETVRKAPKRVRMSVSLWLDNSLSSERQALEQTVRAAVGFDPNRFDQFESALVTFAQLEEADDEEGAQSEVPEEPASNPIIELLLTRGVEAVAALFFLIVLAVSLKRSKSMLAAQTVVPVQPDSAEVAAAVEAAAEPELDPEMIALERVRRLVEEEPDKVGALLTAWARGDEA